MLFCVDCVDIIMILKNFYKLPKIGHIVVQITMLFLSRTFVLKTHEKINVSVWKKTTKFHCMISVN